MKTIVSLLIIFAPAAYAEILAEPYIGYSSGTLSAGNAAVDSKLNGFGLGARVGYQTKGIMAGLDYSAGTWQVGQSSVAPAGTATFAFLGAFVGYNFPIPVRAYFTYDISAHNHVNRGGVSADIRGQGMKVGVGYQAMEWLSINLEYLTHTYTKDDVSQLNPAVKEAMTGLTISSPFLF